MSRLESALEEVSRERIRGASWALSTLARALLEDLEEGYELECDEASRRIESVVRGMASLSNLAWLVRKTCRDREALAESLRGLLSYMDEASSTLAEHAVGLLGGDIVTTISMSSAVLNALVRAGPQAVYVLESRPGGEGAMMAKALAHSGVNALVIPDSALGWALSRSSVAVMGADAVSTGGCVVNKIGSLALASAGRSLGVRVAAVFEAYKSVEVDVCSYEYSIARTYRVEGWGDVFYPVFEPIRLDLIDYLVTDQGVLDSSIDAVRRLRSRFIKYVID